MIVPANIKGKIPFLLIFHGYQGQSSDWSKYMGYVASGMGIVLMDVRGQAGKSQDNTIFDGMTVRGHIIRGIKEGREEGHQAGIKEGREEEREAGIRRLIEDNLEEKKTKEIIIQKLIRWFSMDEQTAQLYLDKYADSAEEMVLD